MDTDERGSIESEVGKQLQPPWELIDKYGENLVAELHRELTSGHVLLGKNVTALARRTDCDDVLFTVDDGSVAVVHLTWSGRPEPDPAWPATTIYRSTDAWISEGMEVDQ